MILIFVSRSVAKAIYGDAPDVDLINDPQLGQVYVLPCDVEINISFKFGGVTFPIHPLDTVLDLGATDDDGKKICIGAVRYLETMPTLTLLMHRQFQPISTAASPNFDMVLGMAFSK